MGVRSDYVVSNMAVVGAGPAGSLLSIYLARQGHQVTVFESRPDLRSVDIDAGRSINLALATRGIVPLIDVGVIAEVDAITIPMRGRMIHTVGDDTPDLLPYGSQTHEVIHSVSRTDLNSILLTAAEKTGTVEILFNTPVESVDFSSNTIQLVETDEPSGPFDAIFGADGAGSRVRKSMGSVGASTFETQWLDHDYKEITIPPAPDGSHRLDPQALHIWPRGEFMLIALANPEGDFTATLFAPKTTFASLSTSAKVEAFFIEHFAQFVAHVPDFAEQYFENATGRLGTLRVDGWNLGGKAVLVGDAAHAIVPFHGQGMNAAMETVRILDRRMRASPDDLAAAFEAFSAERRPDADAIGEMALDNYIEMRSGVTDPNYLAKRSLALELQQRHPDKLSPRYNMVMFSTMPYSEAKQRAEHQGSIIARSVDGEVDDIDALIADISPLPSPDPLADPKALSTS